jgi:hypothetical protein
LLILILSGATVFLALPGFFLPLVEVGVPSSSASSSSITTGAGIFLNQYFYKISHQEYFPWQIKVKIH